MAVDIHEDYIEVFKFLSSGIGAFADEVSEFVGSDQFRLYDVDPVPDLITDYDQGVFIARFYTIIRRSNA